MNVVVTDEGSPSERVVGYFRSRLLSGDLRVGDRVPAERELARQLGVGRPLLRESLRSLAMLGLLQTRHGSGTYIARADFSVLTDFFTFCLSQEHDVLGDIMQARIAIECQAIRLACARANDRDLADIRQWLEALMHTLDDPEAGGHADFMFHQAIVEASHSQSLTTLYSALSTLLKESHIERRRSTYRSPEIVGDLVEAHREVFLAIVGKDPDEADRRLREHFAIGDELRRKSLIETYRRSVD